MRGEDEGTTTSGRQSRPPMTFEELLSTTQVCQAPSAQILEEECLAHASAPGLYTSDRNSRFLGQSPLLLACIFAY